MSLEEIYQRALYRWGSVVHVNKIQLKLRQEKIESRLDSELRDARRRARTPDDADLGECLKAGLRSTLNALNDELIRLEARVDTSVAVFRGRLAADIAESELQDENDFLGYPLIAQVKAISADLDPSPHYQTSIQQVAMLYGCMGLGNDEILIKILKTFFSEEVGSAVNILQLTAEYPKHRYYWTEGALMRNLFSSPLAIRVKIAELSHELAKLNCTPLRENHDGLWRTPPSQEIYLKRLASLGASAEELPPRIHWEDGSWQLAPRVRWQDMLLEE